MTDEEFEQAIRDFNRADEIEKSAKTLRAGAREKILQYFADTETMPQAGQGKMMYTIPSSEIGIKVTVPVKAGLPSRFDTERTEEFYRLVEDTHQPDFVERVFKQHPEFLPDEWLAVAKEQPDQARQMASLLLPYVLPATDPEPMSPRIEAL